MIVVKTAVMMMMMTMMMMTTMIMMMTTMMMMINNAQYLFTFAQANLTKDDSNNADHLHVKILIKLDFTCGYDLHRSSKRKRR